MALTALVATLALETAQEQPLPALYPGKSAPSIQSLKLIKGKSPLQYTSDKLTVVEFWATWCKPCIEGMPHLSKLARQYCGKIDFIGVNTLENLEDRETSVRQFVTDKGNDMDYIVALDDDQNTIQKAFMTASEQNGIPSAFLVNGQGEILWIGHPMNLDPVLEAAVKGNYSVDQGLAAFRQNLVVTRRQAKSMADVQSTRNAYAESIDKAKVIAKLEVLGANEPDMGHSAYIEALNLLATDNQDLTKTKIADYVNSGEYKQQLGTTIFAIINAYQEGDKKALSLYAVETLAVNLKHPRIAGDVADTALTHKRPELAKAVLKRALDQMVGKPDPTKLVAKLQEKLNAIQG